MLKEFKEFATKGNAIDLAVGLMLGATFNSIINSVVRDIITPPIGFLLGRVDFSNLYVLLQEGKTPGPYASLAEAQATGAVTANYGLLFNTIISFLITAFVLFFLVRAINQIRLQTAALEKKEKLAPSAPATRECPYCLSTIPRKATRCACCTSELPPAQGS